MNSEGVGALSNSGAFGGPALRSYVFGVVAGVGLLLLLGRLARTSPVSFASRILEVSLFAREERREDWKVLSAILDSVA